MIFFLIPLCFSPTTDKTILFFPILLNFLMFGECPNLSSDSESFFEQIIEDFAQCEFPIQPRNLSQWMRHTLEMLWEMTLTFLEKMSLSPDTHNLIFPFMGMCFTTKNYSFSWKYVVCPSTVCWGAIWPSIFLTQIRY